MTRGRPLRFLALVLGGWVAMRVAVLWPGGVASVTPVAAQPERSPAHVAPLEIEASAKPHSPRLGEGRGPLAAALVATVDSPWRGPAQPGPGLRRGGAFLQKIGSSDELASARTPTRLDEIGPTEPPVPRQRTAVGVRPVTFAAAPTLVPPTRWHGDLYLFARPTGGDSLAFGQLGASQGGARITYAVDDTQHFALSARASAPVRGRGREAAFGFDLRPTGLPIHLLAEARVPLDGGATRPAAQVIAGHATILPLHFRLEGYAQAGGVYRRGAFADGTARLTRSMLAMHGLVLDLGAGAWAAAQRRVARLDAGPTLGLTLPTPNRTVRVTVDYRLRVAGRARPGTGPAVSLGSSF